MSVSGRENYIPVEENAKYFAVYYRHKAVTTFPYLRLKLKRIFELIALPFSERTLEKGFVKS
jgi:hypothetical protein